MCVCGSVFAKCMYIQYMCNISAILLICSHIALTAIIQFVRSKSSQWDNINTTFEDFLSVLTMKQTDLGLVLGSASS